MEGDGRGGMHVKVVEERRIVLMCKHKEHETSMGL